MIVIASEPDTRAGADRSQEAEELLALGYRFAAAFCARSSLEHATLARIGETIDNPGHKTFRELTKRLNRGCVINGKTLSRARETYRRLSQYLHGEDRWEERVEELIAEANDLRAMFADAPVRILRQSK